MLEKEMKYFEAHKKELLEKYKNRFIVISNCQVEGDFSTEIDAYSAAIENHELGTFLIMDCSETAEPPQIFHTRVAFN